MFFVRSFFSSTSFFTTKAADEDDEFEVEMPNNEVNNEFFVEVEKIMEVVEKMGADVEEVKRTQSAILSSPSTDESKFDCRFRSINFTYRFHLLIWPIRLLIHLSIQPSQN